MKLALSCLLSMLFIVGCNDNGIEGNGHVVEEPRDVGEFSGLRVENGLEVHAELGEPSLVLVLDENLLEHIVTSFDGHELVIRTRDGVDIDPTDRTEIRVSTPTLERLEVSEGSDFRGELGGPEVGYVSVHASGGSEVEGQIQADGLDVTGSGGSDLELTGRVRELFVKASGGTEVESAVDSELLHVDASGGSDVDCSASQRADVSASGGSEVTVHGSPAERTIDASEGSQVAFP